MHLHFEKPVIDLRCDAVVSSLSWMGRVPEEQPEGHGWKLNRTSYYQEGWLATGNLKGVVGVTFTTTLGQRTWASSPALIPLPARTNYNLRGHRAQINLVRWNEPYQKLATCDSSGIIFVWIRYEGRWSIELINDRNTPVTYFSWSHDGRMAVIAYQDGFVLVGSVAGQRYWSTILNQESIITCGTWTPDDQQVYLGTSNGSIVVLDVHNGSVVAQITFAADSSISSLAWNCPRFKMEEPINHESASQQTVDEQHVLAVLTCQGRLSLVKGFDDLTHPIICTDLVNAVMEWNNDGEFICVAGHLTPRLPTLQFDNLVHFYNANGMLRYKIAIPYTQAPITSLTWGHNDRRLFLATGNTIHVAWVSQRIPTLQHLARLCLRNRLANVNVLNQIDVPRAMKNLIVPLFTGTVHCHIPEELKIRDFVCKPPAGNTRLFCTMIRRDEDGSCSSSGEIDPVSVGNGYSTTCGVAFTLYLEYLGGLIPLLKGKPSSKLRPEFVIFDPQHSSAADGLLNLANEMNTDGFCQQKERKFKMSPMMSRKFRPRPAIDHSDSETDESCVSTPRLHRKFRKPSAVKPREENGTNFSDKCSFLLPEESPLAQVASNIWGTKFRIIGLAPNLPSHLGQVTYKTSLLHLQPRQMTLGVIDLREPYAVEDEDDHKVSPTSDDEEDRDASADHAVHEYTPPIAPLTPNLRVRRRAAAGASGGGVKNGRAEPPPSPTHQMHRPLDKSELDNDNRLEEILRIEWSSAGAAERIVLASAVRRQRSLSTGHLDCIFSSSWSVDFKLKGSARTRKSRHSPRRKSRSLDSSPLSCERISLGVRRSWAVQVRQAKKDKSSSLKTRSQIAQGGVKEKRFAMARLSPLFGRKLANNDATGAEPKRKVQNTAGRGSPARGCSEPTTPNGSPNVARRKNPVKSKRNCSPIRQLLNSPMLARRFRKEQVAENSDDDSSLSGDEVNGTVSNGPPAGGRVDAFMAHNYEDLESFQKAQLLNKIRQTLLAEKQMVNDAHNNQIRPGKREFVLHNKAPLWNEHSQVYQLDFGGRVTQESAKNFQIEFKGKQVMQFGRIDGNAYTLDFQYPFSAVQAFAVALANVTQRLK